MSQWAVPVVGFLGAALMFLVIMLLDAWGTPGFGGAGEEETAQKREPEVDGLEPQRQRVHGPGGDAIRRAGGEGDRPITAAYEGKTPGREPRKAGQQPGAARKRAEETPPGAAPPTQGAKLMDQEGDASQRPTPPRSALEWSVLKTVGMLVSFLSLVVLTLGMGVLIAGALMELWDRLGPWLRFAVFGLALLALPALKSVYISWAESKEKSERMWREKSWWRRE